MSKRPQDEKETKGSYTPASPVKRTLAWIGLVYMFLLLGLSLCFYFTGRMLTGLTAFLTLPGLIGLGVLALVSWRSTGAPRKGLAILAALVCWGLALLILPDAVSGLLANFGG